MEKVVSSRYKIRFQDCDPFNHLNNASYINYFLNAREDHLLDNYGLDIFEDLKKSSLAWIVGSNQICYLNPATAAENVIIETQLISLTSKSVLIEMRMWDESKAKLKAMLWTSFIYFNIQTQKVANHSAEMNGFLESIVLPIEQSSFEERRNQLIRRRAA